MRLSFVGELGWELHVPRPACVPVYQAVMTAGAKHGLVNAGYRAIDSLSIEKGASGSHTAPAGRREPTLQTGAVVPPRFFPVPAPLPAYPVMPASPARTPTPAPFLHCP